MRIPVTDKLHIENFSGAGINVADYLGKNTINGEYYERKYVTQRPSINIVSDSSAESSTEDRGRGIYYWAKVGITYVVNGNEIWQDNYTTEVTHTGATGSTVFSNGTEKVYFAELGNYLIILDSENDKAYYIHKDSNDEYTQIFNGAGTEYQNENTFDTADATATGTAQDGWHWASSEWSIGGGVATAAGGGGTEELISDQQAAPYQTYAVTFTLGVALPADIIVGGTSIDPSLWPIVGGTVIDVEVTSVDDGPLIEFWADSGNACTVDNVYLKVKDNIPTSLAAGCVVLDGYLFVMDTDGNIYNSNLNFPNEFGATDFINASRESDSGIYIDKHHDHIVAFGSRTIEFFFNAGNPTNSPLGKRKDVFYNYGLISGESAWREADMIYGVGVYPSGALRPYALRDFQVVPIANPTVESYFTQAHVVDGSRMVGSGFSAGGNTYYTVTFYRIVSDISPDITIVFDGKGWNEWETTIQGHTKFPLIAWSIRTGEDAVSGEGVLSNGDIISVNDDFIPQDSLLASDYYETGVVAAGYVTSALGSTVNIEMICRTGPFDFDSNSWKFMYDLELVGDFTNASQTATIKWADDNSITFNAGRTIDPSQNQKITRLGRFRRRNLEFNMTSDEQFRFEGFECEITKGDE